MPKVKAKILCFVDNGLRQPGDVFQYSGPPNSNLEYLEEAIEDQNVEQPELVAPRRPGRPRKTSTD
jgi:hypothetical protein